MSSTPWAKATRSLAPLLGQRPGDPVVLAEQFGRLVEQRHVGGGPAVQPVA